MPQLAKNVHEIWPILQDIGNAFAATTEQGTLVRVLVDVITRTLHPKRISVYLHSRENKGRLIGVCSTFDDNAVLMSWALIPPLVDLARARDEVIAADALPKGEIAAWMTERGVEVALPIQGSGELYGMVLLQGRCCGDPYTPDDLGLLHVIGKQAAVAFGNAMHYCELRRLNAGLEQQVHQRTCELAEAIEQLRKADQAKDEFLAMLSHELLNPLASIFAWAEVAENQENPALTNKAVEIIRESARRQRRLIDDLLDISRITHGKLVLTVEPVDLWELTVECVEAVYHEEIQRHYRIAVHPPAVPLPVYADRMRMQQVVTNLLNNAVKFTEPGGAITICGERHDGRAVVTVADTGHGISCELLSTIFDPFKQFHRDVAANGLGLGLALVRSLMELQGGAVHVASGGPGQGSRFAITLPLCMHPATH